MLQSIRSRITGWKAIAILLLIGLTFMFFGVGAGGLGVQDYAAKVNGQKVPMSTFRQTLQQEEARYSQYFPDGMPDDQRTQLRERILDSLVRDELVSQRVFDERYRISDETIAKTLREFPSFQMGGQFDRDVYQQQLKLAGQTEAGWEAQMRRSLQIGQFRDALSKSAFVTPQELERRNELENEERVISYAVIPASKFKAQVTVTDADIQTEYDATKANLFTNEQVDIEYIELKTSDLAKDIAVDEAELTDHYKNVQARFGEPEQRRARHILINSNDANDEEKKAFAEDLLAQIKGGADFAELAKTHSDDPGSGREGGDLGFFNDTRMVAPFTEATWALNVDEISAPIKTEYGYHIIQLQEIKASTSPAFTELSEEQRAELQEELKLSKVEGLLTERADKIAQQVFDATDVLDEVAKANGLTVLKQSGIERNTYSGLAAEPAIKTAVFSDELRNGTNSDLIAVNNDHAVFLRVADFRDPRQKTLEEVSLTLRNKLEQDAAAKLASDAGLAIQAEVDSKDALKAKADAAEYSFVADSKVKRNQPGVQRDLLTAVFQANAPVDGAVVEQGVDLTNGDYAIFYLQDVKKVDANLTDTEKEARIRALSLQNGGHELNAYLNSLREDASVEYPAEQETN